MKTKVSSLNITEYLDELAGFLRLAQVTPDKGAPLSLDEGCRKAVELILETKLSAKIMLIGNGGSAAIVSHIQNDLCDSVGVKALVFNEAPFLTAISNDHGYEVFFEQAIKLWAVPEDLLIAVSSSGRSKNILQAVRTAREKGVRVITFSGFSPDNPLRQLGDLNFYIDSKTYGFVETAHAVLGHFLTDCAGACKQEAGVSSSGHE